MNQQKMEIRIGCATACFQMEEDYHGIFQLSFDKEFSILHQLNLKHIHGFGIGVADVGDPKQHSKFLLSTTPSIPANCCDGSEFTVLLDKAYDLLMAYTWTIKPRQIRLGIFKVEFMTNEAIVWLNILSSFICEF